MSSCNTPEHLKALQGMDPVYVLRYLKATLFDRLNFHYGSSRITALNLDRYFSTGLFQNLIPQFCQRVTNSLNTEITSSWLWQMLIMMKENRLLTKPSGQYLQCMSFSKFQFPDSDLPLITRKNYETLSPQKYPEFSTYTTQGSIVADYFMPDQFFFTDPMIPHCIKLILKRLDEMSVCCTGGFYSEYCVKISNEMRDDGTEWYKFEPAFSLNYRAFVADMKGVLHENPVVVGETGVVSGNSEIEVTNVLLPDIMFFIQPIFPDRFEEMFG